MKIDFNFSLRRFGVRRPGAALAVPSLPLNCELSRLARKAISYPGDPVANIGQSAARPGPAPALAGRSLPLNCELSRLARKAIFHPEDRCEDRPKRCPARPGAALAVPSLPLNCEFKSPCPESDFPPGRPLRR